MNLSDWDGAYRGDRRIWGRGPSETALAAGEYFSEAEFATAGKRLLEIGCGYGWDSFFLASRWGLCVTAVDPSPAAVAMARAEGPEHGRPAVEFRTARFQDLADSPYDLVYASNLYQILPPEEREQFPQAVDSLLMPDGLLILGPLSSRDPEHAGNGAAVPGDPNSRIDRTYVHISDRAELETAFPFLEFQKFFEQEYLESRAEGADHHHISWILIAGRKSAGGGKG
ncbi:MAG: class I SAM-dependent methyltransferase [Anaerolineales bacterium]|nr:class I SAM-dependent methyltransferase [Anaerolineales bacterium]